MPSSRHRLLPLLLAASLALGLAACGGDAADDADTAGGTTTAPGAGSAAEPVATDRVAIKDFKFGPEAATVKVGTTVRWINEDGFDHSVVADEGAFKSPDFGKDGDFEHTFSTAGTFTYFCGVHNYMTGKIVVS